MADTLKHDPKQLVRTAEQFFVRLPPRRVPPVLRGPGRWVLLNGESYLALSYVSNSSWRRFQEYTEKGWHPFPGLFAPAGATALIDAQGRDAYFDSNVTRAC